MNHINVSTLFKAFGSLACLAGLLGGSLIARSAVFSFANETAGNLESGSDPRIPAQAVAAFAVSGNVSSDQKPLNGVAITFERVTGIGAVPPAVRTNIQGNWSQSGFVTGTAYRATAAAVGFSFNPGSFEFRSSRVDLNFEGLSSALTASGIVRFAQTAGLPGAPAGGKPPGIEGVTLTFSRVSGTGPVPSPVRTDASGSWSQSGFQTGTTYRAAASKQGFAFNPPGIEISRPDIEGGRTIGGLVIEGSSITFSASGKVSAADARGIPGVRLRFSRVTGTGAVPGEVVTDEKGLWNQAGFERGTVYRITPTRLEVDVFAPRAIDNLSGPPPNAPTQAINQNFQITIPTFRASGRVGTRTRGTGLANLTIVFSRRSGAGQVPPSVTTNERGEWTQQGFEMGTAYAATPAGPFSFAPTTIPFLNTESPDLRDRDFTVPDTFAIGGRLTTTDAEVLRRRLDVSLEIRAVSSGSQEVICVRTPLGVPWIGQGLEAGKTYRIRPIAPGGEAYSFTPDSSTVQGPGNGVNFTVRYDRSIVARFDQSPCPR